LCREFLKNDVEIWKESLHRSHPMLNGKLYKAWKVFDAQLMHQSAAVCFYGFGRKKEITCDLRKERDYLRSQRWIYLQQRAEVPLVHVG
jgi:hypothetical protein